MVHIPGSVAVVFGGGGGFGGETVRRLHAAGGTVVIAEYDESKGKALADELGDRAHFVQADVTSDEIVADVFAQAEKLGPVRVSVTAHGSRAGGGGRTLNKENKAVSQEGFDQTVSIFLLATFRTLRLAAESIAKSEPAEDGERGVIINTASIAGYEGTIGQAAYGAAKAGVIGLTLPAARDLAPVGIRVNTIAPGTFLTPAFGQLDDEQKAQLDALWGNAVLFPSRMGRPNEYAQLAQQLVENRYLNGETIRIDGGLRFTRKGPN